jgi:hypothetical protein
MRAIWGNGEARKNPCQPQVFLNQNNRHPEPFQRRSRVAKRHPERSEAESKGEWGLSPRSRRTSNYLLVGFREQTDVHSYLKANSIISLPSLHVPHPLHVFLLEFSFFLNAPHCPRAKAG